MEGISDIRIIGVDETRPPRILKEPYINLYFKLAHQAPKDWCNDFNNLTSKYTYPAKIEPSTGLYIETWVRKIDEIETSFDTLKTAVSTCNLDYIARIQAQAEAAANTDSLEEDTGEQGRLNKVIAHLNYDD